MERTFKTPLGVMCLTEENGFLISFLWKAGGNDRSPLLLKAEQQLEEYFSGSRHNFDLPLAPSVTAFQESVLKVLESIPYGQTRTYSWVASQIGNPKASRAVGTACNRNPLPILIPCHRIIGASGNLTGYAAGLDAKRWLLNLEGADFGFS